MSNKKKFSEKEMSEFLVKKFDDSHCVSITDWERFDIESKEVKHKAHDLLSKEIRSNILSNDWDLMNFLSLEIDNKTYCFAIDNKLTDNPWFSYKRISRKEYDKAMQERQNKLEAELKRIKKSKLPF